jgi:hypothetical protein
MLLQTHDEHSEVHEGTSEGNDNRRDERELTGDYEKNI